MSSRAETTARERLKAAGNMPPNGIKVGSDLHLCEMLLAELDGEREARFKSDAALRQKDEAMSVLFDRMRVAGVDFSDLIP